MTRLVVAAAVIERDGRLLVTRRPRGAHLAGLWEFPGGKIEGTETLAAGLVREIREELAATVTVGGEILQTSHRYDDRQIDLHFFACELSDEPSPVLGQTMRWVRREELHMLEFPPADAELIQMLACERGSDPEEAVPN